MGRLYKINPPCPKCHEEHNWWHIQLTDEEQAKMDAYVAASEGKSSLELLLGEPGIVVTRKLKCCCCGHVFEAEAGLRKFDEVGYRDRGFLLRRSAKYPCDKIKELMRCIWISRHWESCVKAEDKNGRKYMDWRIPYMDQLGLIMVYKSDSR